MDEHSPPISKPPPPPIRLDYATPDPHRPAGGVAFLAQMALGFVAFVVTLIAVGASLGFLALNRHWGGTESMLEFGGGIVLPVFLLVFFVALARQRWRWPGFGVGVLIGLGLAVLGFGLCFAAFSR